MTPFVLCYYTNKWRLYHLQSRKLLNEKKKHVAAISGGPGNGGISTPVVGKENKFHSPTCCMCCVKPNKLSLTLQTVESKSSPYDNIEIRPPLKQEDDYGNVDICYKLFCCYYRCFNCCHYGLYQGPNAPLLLKFFDPIKNQDDDQDL